MLMALAASVTLTVQAQPSHSRDRMPEPEAMAARSAEHMTTELGLSADQTKQVESVQLAFFQAKSQATEAAGEGNRADKTAMKTAYDTRESQLRDILSPDQYQTMKAKQEQRMQERKQEVTPEEMAKKSTERLTKDLGLSADQAKKVQPIELSFAKARHEARPATPGERPNPDLMKNAKATHDAALKGVLTADQYKKFQEMEAQRRQDHPGGPGGPGGQGRSGTPPPPKN